jgi:hypothetical protein
LVFYQQLSQGRTVAEAVREMRRHFYEDDDPRMLYHPTWLAYSLHCHPNIGIEYQTRN